MCFICVKEQPMNKRKIKEFIKGFKELSLKNKILFTLLLLGVAVLFIGLALLTGIWIVAHILNRIDRLFRLQNLKEVFAFISVI